MVNDSTFGAVLAGILQALGYFSAIPLFDVTLLGTHYTVSLLDAGISYMVFTTLLTVVLGIFHFDGKPDPWEDDE